MVVVKRVMVCWVGGRDIEAAKMPDEARSDECGTILPGGFGPILSTLKDRPHDELNLLYNYKKSEVNEYVGWLKRQIDIEVHTHQAEHIIPTDYTDIYMEASAVLDVVTIKRDIPVDNVSILISPGTPAMQAIWILLAKTTYPVKLLESSKEQGVKEAKIPFDIYAEFLPDLLSDADSSLKRLSSGNIRVAPEFESILTQNPEVEAQKDRARKVSGMDIPVLILGESGTGKELFARAIHRSSRRCEKELVSVNCGALAPELIESELFGHIKGGFTGAIKDKVGFFEEADGGTIFLDEFGELSLGAQVRLLRVLQDGTFNRVGDSKPTKVDVRVIVATNRDLGKEISEGRFREDLFYRVAVGVINLPPLRSREGDLSLLTDALLGNINEQLRVEKKISSSVRKILSSHGWPGNIRELNATLTRAHIWSEKKMIDEKDINAALLKPVERSGDILGINLDNPIDIQDLIKKLKRHYIERALKKTNRNLTNAAALLGLKSYQVLKGWMKEIDLEN